MDLETGDVFNLNFSLITTTVVKPYDLNLKIFVHWSKWSECDGIRNYRTRQGLNS